MKFNEEIRHVLFLSKELFLVLTHCGTYKVDGNLAKIVEIQLEDIPKSINSGTVIRNSFFFLHVKVDNKTYEGRIYNLEGKLTSRIEVPKKLK